MSRITKEFYWNAGNRIRNFRIRRGYSVEQLAEAADISTKYLYQIENGAVHFSTGIFYKICNALDVSSAEILKEPPQASSLLSDSMKNFTEQDREYIRKIIIEEVIKSFHEHYGNIDS